MISNLHCTKASSVNQILSIGWVFFKFSFISSFVFPFSSLIFNCIVALGLDVLPHDTRLIPMEAIGIDAVRPFSFSGVSNERLS